MSLWNGALPFAALGLLLGNALDRDTGAIVALGFVLALAILGGLVAPIATQTSKGRRSRACYLHTIWRPGLDGDRRARTRPDRCHGTGRVHRRIGRDPEMAARQ